MKPTDTKKTPVAELGGTRDEGLNSPLTKKESTTMIPTAGVSTRLDFDGLSVDVDAIDEHVEITTGIPGRTTLGLALTPAEARRLAEALLDASAPAFGETPLAEIEEHARIARKNTMSVTPAKAAKQMREARR